MKRLIKLLICFALVALLASISAAENLASSSNTTIEALKNRIEHAKNLYDRGELSPVEMKRVGYYYKLELALNSYLNYQPLNQQQEELLISEGVLPSENEIDEMGGPDLFGYMYMDSQEIGGPAFNWVDISGTGTMITGLDNDITLGPFEIGFDFPFYENNYNEFYLCSHGWLSFTSTNVNWTNTMLPDVIEPNDMIAFYWDDWIVDWYSTAYYETIDDMLIVQIEHDSGPCQVQLMEDGTIYMMYNDGFVGPGQYVGGESIGIENIDGTDGLQVSYNDDPLEYPFGELAIMYYLGEPPEPADLTLELTPIPHYPWDDLSFPIWQGGWFQYLVEITNNTDEEIVYDAWVRFILPDHLGGEEQDYLLKYFEDLVIGPGEYVAVTPWQCVPPCEHDWWGTYTMIARLGEYDDVVWASDQFDIYIEPDEDFMTIPNGDVEFNIDGFTTFGWDWPNSDYSTLDVIPTQFAIDKVYPNPFNPATNVAVSLPLASALKVSVFNVMGQEVARLADGRFAEGYHSFTFDAVDMASGIYFIQVIVPGKMNEMRKVMLLK